MKHGNGLFLLYRKLRRISCKAKKRFAWIALRRKRNLSLREPPQAENPALQDSIFKKKYGEKCWKIGIWTCNHSGKRI